MFDRVSGVAVFRLILMTLSIAWVIWVGSHAAERWPTIPLDIDPKDIETRAAYDAVITRHAAYAGALASIGPLCALLLAYVFRPRKS